MSSSSPADKSAKKLKQACLPFKLVNSPSDDANSKCRKRKLSGTENDDTRVENPKVELLNGGTKCFIKSDEEINDEDIDMKVKDAEEPESLVLPLENIIENNDKSINNEETTKVDEKVVDDSIYVSSDSDNAQNDTSINSTSDSGQPNTPTSKNFKQSTKKQESANRQKERLRLKLEKEKAREEKLKEQAEKLLLKEQKRNAEIEAKRLRDLEKKQKEEEKKAKELEKEKERALKEEEKKAKELEKEKQKEEKLLREEMEKKKKDKVKAAFVGFFKAKNFNSDTSKKDGEIVNQEQETFFMPFQTKQDMKMAPSCRVYLNSNRKQLMDNCICQYEQNKDQLYLNLLKTKKYKPSKSDRTWPAHVENDEDLIIIETGSTSVEDDENTIDSSLKNNFQKNRWKLLQFKENKRPPYWGTWRKKSIFVKPRRPFAYDKVMFDYEIDSDDEWEEEDPGESIHGTDNEEEPEDDYEVDNDVFVPHGYLSDEEGQDNDTDDSEEAQKEKLKLLGEEFEAEIKKKTQRIKPRLVGCIWIPNNVTNPENVSKSVADTLLKYRSIWDDEEPIITEAPIIVDTLKDLSTSEKKKKILLPDSRIPDLITFIHGNSSGIKVAANNFIAEIMKNGQNIDDNISISVSSVMRTIKAIATKATFMSPWCVSKDNFEQYGVEYPKSLEIEVPKVVKSSSVKKITSFMKLPNQKANTTVLNKSCTEIDESVSESTESDFIPKNLFNHEKCPKDVVKEEQKVNIVGGKKRITPILLSPKKNFKSITNRKPKEKSQSPELEIVCEGPSNSIVKTV